MVTDTDPKSNGKSTGWFAGAFGNLLENLEELGDIVDNTFMGLAYRIVGGRNSKLLHDMRPAIDQIHSLEESLEALPDDQLKEKTSELRRRIHQEFVRNNVYRLLDSYEQHLSRMLSTGDEYTIKDLKRLREDARACAEQDKKEGMKRREKILDDILPEAFALVREAAGRNFADKPRFGKHFDVQLQGGIALHHGNVAEMMTGEGKTLAATLPAYLNALELNEEWIQKAKERFGEDVNDWIFDPIDGVPVNKGVHVITVNDFLARRDAQWMGEVYEKLGLSTGAIWDQMESKLGTDARKAAYAKDITYGTSNQFGFDYLRDNMVSDVSEQCQRGFHFGIVDEADSILIDEATTPLIISQTKGHNVVDVRRAQEAVADFEGREKGEDEEDYAEDDSVDFVYDIKIKRPIWTTRGIKKIEKLQAEHGEYFEHLLTQAVRARDFFEKDKHYMVSAEEEKSSAEVIIIDERTGYPAIGRRWTDGLHQAIEAKHEFDESLDEKPKIKEEKETFATVTLQNFFKLYDKLSGMTGTAMTEANEFYKIYGLDVINIPTNKPLIRKEHNDLVYLNKVFKWISALSEILDYHVRGQPVLVGTRSVEDSIMLSTLLKNKKLVEGILVKGRPDLVGEMTQQELVLYSFMFGIHPLEVMKEPQQAVKKVNAGFKKIEQLISTWGIVDSCGQLDVEQISKGLEHEVLNAKKENLEREDKIIAKAGELARITVATNMAGRGTDIVLGKYNVEELLVHWKKYGIAPADLQADDPDLKEKLKQYWTEKKIVHPHTGKEVSLLDYWNKREMYDLLEVFDDDQKGTLTDLGGLHVVGTERHMSRRVDNQLRGRAGRQGDKGSSRFIICLEDELPKRTKAGSEGMKNFLSNTPMGEGKPYNNVFVTYGIRKGQANVENQHFNSRKNLYEYDKVLDVQRKRIYDIRQNLIEGKNISDIVVNDFLGASVRDSVDSILLNDDGSKVQIEEDQVRQIQELMKRKFNIIVSGKSIASLGERQGITNYLVDKLRQSYAKQKSRFSNMEGILALKILSSLQDHWPGHLTTMNTLKTQIAFRGYSGDPKIAYSREGFSIFNDMMRSVREEVLDFASDRYFMVYHESVRF